MKCDRCQKAEATLHVTQTRQGKTVEYHLCEACARELGIGHHVNDYFGSIGKLIGGNIFNLTGGIPAFGTKEEQKVACPFCGQTFDEFRQTGLFGCSHCYDTFSDRLDPVFRRVQGSVHHTGQRTLTPKDQEKRRLFSQLQDMKKKLHQAVEKEAYEDAARLRDDIHDLEKKIASQTQGRQAT